MQINEVQKRKVKNLFKQFYSCLVLSLLLSYEPLLKTDLTCLPTNLNCWLIICFLWHIHLQLFHLCLKICLQSNLKKQIWYKKINMFKKFARSLFIVIAYTSLVSLLSTIAEIDQSAICQHLFVKKCRNYK